MLTRRQILQGLGATGLGLSLPWRKSFLTGKEAENDPHYFLQIIIPGGVDATYTFDARPLQFTQEGYLQNYIGEEPMPFSGKNGQQSLRTKLTDPLMPFFKDFSILNGVHMSTLFDGHEQNINFAMTGNPFGGEAFVPFLNTGARTSAVDYLRTGLGNFLVDLSNTSNSITLSAEAARGFTHIFSSVPSVDPRSPLFKRALAATTTIDPSYGKIAALSGEMQTAMQKVPSLLDSIRHVSILKDEAQMDNNPNGESILESASLIGSFFKANLAKSSIYIFNTDINRDIEIDVHDQKGAAKLPQTLTFVFSELIRLLQYFKDTPYDDKKSLFDVTTFMICTEFSRTMRQRREPGKIEEQGSDHNGLNNTVLLGGKGIEAGLVLGASDFQSLDEIKNLPEVCAHRELDRASLRIMGQPFDFSSGQPVPVVHAKYNPSDYLNFTSINNTIFKLFGVDEKFYQKVDRNGDASPVLGQLLS